ncbi:MAG: hypothetical protein L6Q37_05770 [Bdellovibrionaceae bacterium]|nr:hypothetical protein [Pseudobdellovibrionaceae bacterium]NUM58729.1 hypothetical protein [Pseudobdellovibrionaceae bacterium]
MSQNNWKQEQWKVNIFSFLIIISSFLTPISFTYFLQNKITLALSFLLSMNFILLIFVFSYLKQQALQRYQQGLSQLKKGTVIKKKHTQSALYEITQESFNYFHLSGLNNSHKLMVSKEKISKDFELHMN